MSDKKKNAEVVTKTAQDLLISQELGLLKQINERTDDIFARHAAAGVHTSEYQASKLAVLMIAKGL